MNKQAMLVKIYAGGWGTDKERRGVLRAANEETLRLALVLCRKTTGGFFRKNMAISLIEAELNRRKS